MKVQKSYKSEKGLLYLVATPIGNLQDFSSRAQMVLESVSLIAAEDTRHTRKLLSHFSISKPLISYHEHNEKKQSDRLLEQLKQGESVAVVSDAGMPALSDPGAEIVKKAIEEGIPVIPVPGPNAAMTALIASGIRVQPHLFLGFLPRSSQQRKKELDQWKEIPATLILYESPHRILALLKDVLEVFGDRQMAVVRELTKKHEEWLRGSCKECLEYLKTQGPRGEFTLIIEGDVGEKKDQVHWWRELSVTAHVDHYVRNGWMKKDAIREVAKERNLPKREIYQIYHKK